MKSKTICFLICLFLALSLLPFASAASYTLYSNTSPSDTVVVNLLGLYQNSDDFDPFNEYVCIRTDQHDYYLFYSPNLAGDYSFIRYFGITQGYNTVYQYQTGTGSDLSINLNGFRPVGNINDSIMSDRAENFKYQYILIILVLLIAVVVLFKTFRLRFQTKKEKGWTL